MESKQRWELDGLPVLLPLKEKVLLHKCRAFSGLQS